MMVSLTTFEAPLLRLILCGGGGLAPAYGPVLGHELDGTPRIPWLWDPRAKCFVNGSCRRDPFNACDLREGWSLSLDPASPWPARLALVAAWMAGYQDERWAWVDLRGSDEGRIGLSVEGTLMATWEVRDGAGAANRHLPTLPAHLAAHPPAIALLLALYDVPEIRARVEAL